MKPRQQRNREGARAIRAMLLALAASGAPSAAEAFGLRGSLLGNGGDPGAAAGLVLSGTVGQAIVGSSRNAGLVLCHDFWCLGGPGVVGTRQVAGPERPALGEPAPNPASGAVAFSVFLPEAGRVELSIYDAQGRMVHTLAAGWLEAGAHRLLWGGARAGGGSEGSGVYFARLVVNGEIADKGTVVVLRSGQAAGTGR